jgi:hypothetical protein
MAHADPFNRLPAEIKARLRKRPHPEWVAPMLATLTDERFRARDGFLNRSGMASAALPFAAVAA